jgi:hypothetical protein
MVLGVPGGGGGVGSGNRRMWRGGERGGVESELWPGCVQDPPGGERDL